MGEGHSVKRYAVCLCLLLCIPSSGQESLTLALGPRYPLPLEPQAAAPVKIASKSTNGVTLLTLTEPGLTWAGASPLDRCEAYELKEGWLVVVSAGVPAVDLHVMVKASHHSWVHTIGPQPPPTPKPDPPVIVPPPKPDPPKPVEGKRALLIVRETDEPNASISRLITSLRYGANSDYLTSKGHTLHILDDDHPSQLLNDWRPHFKDMKLPVLFILDQSNPPQLIYKAQLSDKATADQVIEKVKEVGG